MLHVLLVLFQRHLGLLLGGEHDLGVPVRAAVLTAINLHVQGVAHGGEPLLHGIVLVVIYLGTHFHADNFTSAMSRSVTLKGIPFIWTMCLMKNISMYLGQDSVRLLFWPTLPSFFLPGTHVLLVF